VKHTEPGGYLGSIEMKGKIVHQLESPKQNEEVEDVIENGVINTFGVDVDLNHLVEDTIQNGVKVTKPEYIEGDLAMEEVIQNGVKHTEYGDWEDGDERLDEIIQNGIKETRWRRVDNHPTFVDCIIEIKNPPLKEGFFILTTC
jgi:hypothetical protein